MADEELPRSPLQFLAELLFGRPVLKPRVPEASVSERQQIQIARLTDLVLALLMEVEALRETFIGEASERGQHPAESMYARAYWHIGLLTHSAQGTSGGLEKLLAQWLPSGPPQMRGRRSLRELSMLRRLGFSDTQLAAYAKAAEDAEMLT
jgi:hypothetical protein